MTDIRVVSEAKVILGESPQWDADLNRLYWVDSMKRQILRCAPDGSDLQQWEVPSLLGFLVLRQKGGAFVSQLRAARSVRVWRPRGANHR